MPVLTECSYSGTKTNRLQSGLTQLTPEIINTIPWDCKVADVSATANSKSSRFILVVDLVFNPTGGKLTVIDGFGAEDMTSCVNQPNSNPMYRSICSPLCLGMNFFHPDSSNVSPGGDKALVVQSPSHGRPSSFLRLPAHRQPKDLGYLSNRARFGRYQKILMYFKVSRQCLDYWVRLALCMHSPHGKKSGRKDYHSKVVGKSRRFSEAECAQVNGLHSRRMNG